MKGNFVWCWVGLIDLVHLKITSCNRNFSTNNRKFIQISNLFNYRWSVVVGGVGVVGDVGAVLLLSKCKRCETDGNMSPEWLTENFCWHIKRANEQQHQQQQQ